MYKQKIPGLSKIQYHLTYKNAILYGILVIHQIPHSFLGCCEMPSVDGYRARKINSELS
jgi:hypothetical protein